MLGVYDYTVILTYLSVISASYGIISAFTSHGLVISACCLLLCGILDAFDGKVARTKKNRTDYERKFGIQIDSLSDIIAFGILPACMGITVIQSSEHFASFPPVITKICILFNILYTLCGLIRLAHFNVTEDDRQKTEGGLRTYYTGVPITGAVFVFPFIVFLQFALSIDLAVLYTCFIVLAGFLFIADIKIKKLNLKQILGFMGTGIAVAIVLLYIFITKR